VGWAQVQGSVGASTQLVVAGGNTALNTSQGYSSNPADFVLGAAGVTLTNAGTYRVSYRITVVNTATPTIVNTFLRCPTAVSDSGAQTVVQPATDGSFSTLDNDFTFFTVAGQLLQFVVYASGNNITVTGANAPFGNPNTAGLVAQITRLA
jgi:hypothetical protein